MAGAATGTPLLAEHYETGGAGKLPGEKPLAVEQDAKVKAVWWPHGSGPGTLVLTDRRLLWLPKEHRKARHADEVTSR